MTKPSRMIMLLALLGVLLFSAMPADAQREGVLIISTADVTSFPQITFHMDAYDEQGAFLSSIQAGNLEIVEDGRALQAGKVTKISNGLQVIVAINLAPSLAEKVNGESDYQRIQTALSGWAYQQPANTPDDFSLSTPTGLFLIRSREAGELARAISEYQPELARTQPALSSLAEALDLATDPLERPLLKRSILYITPPLPNNLTGTLPDLAARAREIGVRVNVWLVGAEADSTAASPLRQLAEGTGGQFAAAAKGGALPPVENMFRAYRQTYEVTYTSAIKTGGDHTLSVQIENADLNLASNERSFPLTIMAPNPIFLSPPESIRRTWATGEANPTPALAPDTVELQILIEFPDQRQRDLKATRLYVNGTLADENTMPPFERFEWDISAIDASTRQVLKVEAEDMLGLSGSSMETPVEVLIDQPARANVIERLNGRSIIAISAVGVAGVALVVVLVLAGTTRSAGWKRRKTEKQLMKDPVTQPVSIAQDSKRKRKEKGNHRTPAKAAARASAAWPIWPKQAGSLPAAPARLVALNDDEQPVTGGTVLLSRQEITFGSDPRRATQVLESPTVDGLHARLYRGQDGGFFLADQGSVAGTWVNYMPVSSEGAPLNHGDVVQIGRVTYRFERTDSAAPAPAEIKVTPLDRSL